MDALETLPKRIIINGNVSRAVSRGKLTIYRVLDVTEKYCHVIELGTDIVTKENGILETIFVAKPPNKKTRARERWPRAEFDREFENGTILKTHEHGIPEQMKEEIPVGTNRELDFRRGVVKAIEEFAKGRPLEDSTTYSKALEDVAKRNSIGMNTAREQYEMHLFYGGHPNALMDHTWLRGGPGKGRRHLRVSLGRKTGAEKDFKGTKHKRRRLKQQVYAEYRNFIKDQANKNENDFPAIYHRWLTSRIAANRNKEGDLVYYPVDESRFPGDDNMKRIGRRMLKEFREAKHAGRPARTGSRGGNATDIVKDQLPVWDLDSTIADNFLQFGSRTISVEGVGKPTVTFATCRNSKAVVGWYVSFGAENGDAYLNTVFCAATDKYRELYRWKMPHLYPGMVYGCAAEVFLDRGPGISMRAQKSLVEQFRAGAKMAQPGTPEGKGCVEQVMRYFQDALKHIAGSVFNVGDDDENWERHKVARKDAVTEEQFMQALLTAISRRNLEVDASDRLDGDMLKAEVAGSPAAVFAANKAYSRGDIAWDWEVEDVFERLCIQSVKKAPKGVITLDKRTFTSPELQIYASAVSRMNNGRAAQIKIYEVPNAPFLLLWKLPGGGKGILDATPKTQKYYEDGGMFSIHFQNNYRKHLYAEARWLGRREATKAAMEVIQRAKETSAAEVSQTRQSDIDDVEQKAEDVVPLVFATDTPRQKAKKVSEFETAVSALTAAVPGYSPPTPRRTQGPSSAPTVSSINNNQSIFVEDDD